MKSHNAGLREVISALAVVASLVFVGLEIRQNTAAQRSQTRQAIADQFADLTMRLSENTELLRNFGIVFSSSEDTTSVLSSLDSAQVFGVGHAFLRGGRERVPAVSGGSVRPGDP